MKPTSPYSEFSEQVIVLHKEILAAAEDNPETQFLLKGCPAAVSPLLEKPRDLENADLKIPLLHFLIILGRKY